MPEHSPNYPPLRRGWITSSSCGDGSLAAVLSEATGTGWQGIAYTTVGACALRGVHGVAGSTRLRNTDGSEVDPGTVYELRLWSVDTSDDTALLARELRWLNGTGGVKLAVYTATEDAHDATPCWYRRNSYLQHGADAPFKGSDTMTSIEVFTEESTYGNTVFIDEIMTGRWSFNG
ncbi:hypothetical protein CWT12_11295 [Actinomyces sp. 432]|uniref:hypothetical protein n=1 Tax=Actinomyces sp. 432 TaxID=2057798 RepID=UPI0013740BA9|nr:hypothetical protein [Actinomyces sp. 432]QHO91773.1 hypothetical protein CWT12_11295 [Actinomyces sp. 432]